jgi:hypothetical protein
MNGTPKELPFVAIEIFFAGNELPIMNGDANTDKNLQISNIPSAPAIYSVAPYSAGPGISKERATQWGHTGIIIDCQKVSGKEDTYKLTYFHTGSSFKGKPYNCAITTNEFKVSDAVTYVNIGNYMK